MIRRYQSLRQDRTTIKAFIQKNASDQPDVEFSKCVLVAEDKRFFLHRGVDAIALTRAFCWFIVGRARGGASTIDMQLVRMITDRRERSLKRKLREIVLARRLNAELSKAHIFAIYMRHAYFGNKLEGAEEASHFLFRKNLSECTIAQKAVLAALLVYPVPTDRTIGWYKAVFKRARWILIRRQQVDPFAIR